MFDGLSVEDENADIDEDEFDDDERIEKD